MTIVKPTSETILTHLLRILGLTGEIPTIHNRATHVGKPAFESQSQVPPEDLKIMRANIPESYETPDWVKVLTEQHERHCVPFAVVVQERLQGRVEDDGSLVAFPPYRIQVHVGQGVQVSVEVQREG